VVSAAGEAEHAVFASNGQRVHEVFEACARGSDLRRVAKTFGLDEMDLIAALAWPILSDELERLPLVQSKPRFPALRAALQADALVPLFPDADRALVQSLAAGLLQIHDFWEDSHTAAQEADDAGEHRFAPYWHGIAHRREPDAGNAAYWFRRVRRHPVFPALAERARGVVGSEDSAILGKDGQSWDPFAMIRLCVEARAGADRARLAEELQHVELALLLDETASALG
jgi:hypothetical protein